MKALGLTTMAHNTFQLFIPSACPPKMVQLDDDIFFHQPFSHKKMHHSLPITECKVKFHYISFAGS